MRTTLYRVDIVDIRIYLLGVACVVLESDLDRDDLVCLEINRSLDELLGTTVKIIDEFLETFLGLEYIASVVSGLKLVSVLVKIIYKRPLVGK